MLKLLAVVLGFTALVGGGAGLAMATQPEPSHNAQPTPTCGGCCGPVEAVAAPVFDPTAVEVSQPNGSACCSSKSVVAVTDAQSCCSSAGAATASGDGDQDSAE